MNYLCIFVGLLNRNFHIELKNSFQDLSSKMRVELKHPNLDSKTKERMRVLLKYNVSKKL